MSFSFWSFVFLFKSAYGILFYWIRFYIAIIFIVSTTAPRGRKIVRQRTYSKKNYTFSLKMITFWNMRVWNFRENDSSETIFLNKWKSDYLLKKLLSSNWKVTCYILWKELILTYVLLTCFSWDVIKNFHDSHSWDFENRHVTAESWFHPEFSVNVWAEIS